jgi:nicotinamidase-related amidase
MLHIHAWHVDILLVHCGQAVAESKIFRRVLLHSGVYYTVMEGSKLLLLVDVQNGFMDAPGPQAVKPALVGLAHRWQNLGWPIVCSRFANLPGSNWERLRDWHEMQSEPDTALIAELSDVTPYMFKKSTYAAWSEEILSVCQSHGTRDVVIAGVDTNECVFATALAVFDSGYTPWIVADACASGGGDKPHAMALELLGALLGKQQIVSLQDLPTGHWPANSLH